MPIQGTAADIMKMAMRSRATVKRSWLPEFTGLILFDSWESKYRYNLVRPITYIVNVIDPAYDYNDLPVNTPPFPEYTSGHSVQSGATAEVLTSLFGNSFSFTDHTHDQLGYAARSYTSFYEAADEAAISRLYGGIHYRAAIENGVDQGKKVGGQVIQSIDWGN